MKDVNRLTPDEAMAVLDEYRQFFAYGPPYPQPSPNEAVLKERDAKIIAALRERARQRPETP